MRCCGIGHERQGSCGNRPEKCVMCAGAHPASEHQCGVNGCNKGKGRLCAHSIARCANCQSNHTANSAQCSSRQKAEIQARKNKTDRKLEEAAKVPSATASNEEIQNPATTDQEMDQREEWAKSPTPEPSLEFSPKSRNHIQDY